MSAGINIPEVEAWLEDAQFDRPFDAGISQKRWESFLADAQAFTAGGWLRRASELGWLASELFGVDPSTPLDNPAEGRTGLVPAMHGRIIAGLKLDYALLKKSADGDCVIQSRWLQNVARHRKQPPLVLIWDLCPTRTLQLKEAM